SAATLAAKSRRCDADEIDGAEAAGQIGRHGNDGARLAIVGNADECHDAGTEARLAVVGKSLQILRVDTGNGLAEELDAGDLTHRVSRTALPAAHRELALGIGELAFQLAAFFHQR